MGKIKKFRGHPSSSELAKLPTTIHAQQVDRLSNARLVLNGIHLFCSVCLLSSPYGLKDSGWLGILIFSIFCAFAMFSAYLLGMCFDNRPHFIRTYPLVGEAAFGVAGRRFIALIVFCLTYATCIESTIVARDALIYVFPKEALKVGEHGFTMGVLIAYIMVLLMLFAVCLFDIGSLDIWFTVVICLFWVGLDKDIEYQTETTVLLNISSLPMAIGFFGYCFAGHNYLPELYQSLRNREQYMTIVIYIIGPTMILYMGASVMGYSLFGKDVESLFILSMPKSYSATYVALGSTIIHQCIRYLFGVHEMARTLNQALMWLNLENPGRRVLDVVIKVVLVATTIPISLVVPIYGVLMAFLGSLLGTIASLIIPCACFLSIRRGRFTRAEGICARVLLLLAVVAAIMGIHKSILEF